MTAPTDALVLARNVVGGNYGTGSMHEMFILARALLDTQAQLDILGNDLVLLKDWIRNDSDCCYGGSCVAIEIAERLEKILADRVNLRRVLEGFSAV